MTLLVDDLIRDFRSDVYDRADVDDNGVARDTLWSDDDVMRYLNDAVAQWAADTLAYRRSFEFDLVPNQAVYRTPFEIIEVVQATYRPLNGGRARLLWVFNQDDGYIQDDYGQMFYTVADLDARTGMPRGISFDFAPMSARLYPVPDAATLGSIFVNAVVYPPQLFPGMPLPSNNRQDRHLLLAWMKKLAYAKQDADTLDLARSKDFENEYSALLTRRMYSYDRAVRNGGVVRPRW